MRVYKSSVTVPRHCIFCKNPAHYEKTNYIDIKIHFIKNEVSKGMIKMVNIHIDDSPADMLIKVVYVGKFKKCLDLIGVCGSSYA